MVEGPVVVVLEVGTGIGLGGDLQNNTSTLANIGPEKGRYGWQVILG